MAMRRVLVLLLGLLVLSVASSFAAIGRAALPAQGTPAACSPLTRAASVAATPAVRPRPPSPPVDAVPMTVGFVPVSIYAPIFVAKEKGYYAEEGLDVTLEPLAGGADLVALTASGQLQATGAGAGPAFWNAMALGLPLAVVAPGHFEGSPVATPLMISREACESGRIASVADLAGKMVSVNARGATEFWLAQALSLGGLTLDDIDLQTLAFPDAVVALSAGAIDAAMVGEPLATKAELDGLAVRLAADFPVQDVMPTLILANTDWAAANPEAMVGFVRAYLRAQRDLMDGGFQDPAILAMIEQYTNVPAALAASAVPPRYAPDEAIDPTSLARLQSFFRERGQLEYDDDIDPASIIDPTYIERAREGASDSAS